MVEIPSSVMCKNVPQKVPIIVLERVAEHYQASVVKKVLRNIGEKVCWTDTDELGYGYRSITMLNSGTRYLSDKGIYDLLMRIDSGYLATEDEMRMLSSVTSIEWRDISVLPNSLGMLRALEKLNIRFSEVSEISVLSNLTSLSFLDLSRTNVSDISALSNLTSLSRINLENSKVSDISALAGLKALKNLNLGGLEINDISVISKLTALDGLNLQDSKTAAIPESVLNFEHVYFIKEKYNYSYLSNVGIFIHGLELYDQPIEIFSQNIDLIRAYYTDKCIVPVNECKVIFLGDAESGKTYSIRRLLNNGEYLEEFDGDSTPGIEITVNSNKIKNTDIVVNYWDFGGQEIQHSMHRVFLTERTVYVVFLNARQDDLMDERARYWLENIKTFAPEAPVLVVINKTDQNGHPRFNEKGFLKSYGNQVKNLIRMSAKKDEPEVFLDKLQGNINSIIEELPTISKRIPQSWKKLMGSIRNMEDNYLTTEQFIDECDLNGIKNHKEIHYGIIDLLMEIGISFCYYKDRSVANYMLLNPKWMLNALYTIVTNGTVLACNGILTENDLYNLLDRDTVNGVTIRRVIPELRYKPFEVNYILGVIRMFSLSYRMKDGSEFFPMLCDGDEKISVKEAVPENSLHYIFRYKYLPTNVMHRLIVEMQGNLDYQYVWYTGAVFRDSIQHKMAYIHSIANDLHVYIYGEENYYNPNKYLSEISDIIRNINNSMGLSPAEFLTCRINEVEAVIRYKEVEGNLQNGIYEVYNATLDAKIRLVELYRRFYDIRPRAEFFLRTIVTALQVMQNDRTYYNDEESRNRLVFKHLDKQLQGTEYTCLKESPVGGGVWGKDFGVRDIVVNDEGGQEFLVFEGTKLTVFNKEYIDEHIKKVLKNNNPKGLRYNVLVTYLECEREKFKSFTDKYREHIEEYAPEGFKCSGKSEGVRCDGEFISCMKMEYEVVETRFAIYHIIVRVAP